MHTSTHPHLDPDGAIWMPVDDGTFITVDAAGHTERRWALPGTADELVLADDALPGVLDAISDIPMPEPVREQIADRLGVDIENVGTAAPTRKRAA